MGTFERRVNWLCLVEGAKQSGNDVGYAVQVMDA